MNLEHLINPLNLSSYSDEFIKITKKVEVPAKTILLDEGERADKLYIVKNGCLRLFFVKDGRDISVQFFFENEAVASAESFFTGRPSEFYLETIEKSVLLEIRLSSLRAFAENHPELKSKYIKGLEERFMYYARLYLSYIKDTPEERYLNLLREHPEIIKRVPQHYIASYLGITPVSLSRLRSRIARRSRNLLTKDNV